MVRFCFHSVRSRLQVPPAAAWRSEREFIDGEGVQSVHPEWFELWCRKMKTVCGDNFVVTFDDAYRDCLIPAIRAVGMGIRVIIFVPTAHVGQLFPYAPYDVMTWDEILFAADNGVEIGSHGHRHDDMTKMSAFGYEDFCTSVNILRRRVKYCNVFAPPHGHFNFALANAAERFGIELWGTYLNSMDHDLSSRECVSFRCLADQDGFLDGEGNPKKWSDIGLEGL